MAMSPPQRGPVGLALLQQLASVLPSRDVGALESPGGQKKLLGEYYDLFLALTLMSSYEVHSLVSLLIPTRIEAPRR